MKRLIHIVKELIRCNFQNINFPKMMVVSYLESKITCLNASQTKNWISKTLSTIAIL